MFTSRGEDKTPRWIIADGCSEPTLISREKEEGEPEGEEEAGKGKAGDKKENESGKKTAGNEDKGESLLLHVPMCICIVHVHVDREVKATEKWLHLI